VAALTKAEQIDDLARQVKARYSLATALRMSAHRESAITHYAQLIALANDHEMARRLQGNLNSLTYLANAFTNFVSAGRYVPMMTTAALYQVLDEAETFLDSVGHREWLHAVRLLRGTLLKYEHRYEQARVELEAALALRRRDSRWGGYTLTTHLGRLGDLLVEMKAYDAAEHCFREMLEKNSDRFTRSWASQSMSTVEYGREKWGDAEYWAREALALSHQMQVPEELIIAYEALIDALLGQGALEAAMPEVGAYFRAVHSAGTVENRYKFTQRMAQFRMAQARMLAGSSARLNDPLPAAMAPSPLARRRLHSAKHWIKWAQPDADALDRQAAIHENQDKLAELRAQCDVLAAKFPEATP